VSLKQLLITTTFVLSSMAVRAADLTEGSAAPDFSLPNQSGKNFDLQSRKGSWTVLYFYPKAETPGCTKQACAFRDNIEKIRKLGAQVYGVSVNSVDDQEQFSKNHHLNFDLLADKDAKVTELYGTKMWALKMSKRWTFILDPDLKIRSIEKDVDPVKDADKVADKIKELQSTASPTKT
jgi:peroxiredoxin Q/BCP